MAGGREEFTLDNGNKFYIKRYDAFLSLKILGEVQKKFLTPVAALIEAANQPGEEVDLEKVMKALERVSMNLDGDSLVAICRTVLDSNYISVSIEGEPPDMLSEGMLNRAVDNVFDVISLIVEVLKVNYQELFTRSRSLIGRVQPGMAIH